MEDKNKFNITEDETVTLNFSVSDLAFSEYKAKQNKENCCGVIVLSKIEDERCIIKISSYGTFDHIINTLTSFLLYTLFSSFIEEEDKPGEDARIEELHDYLKYFCTVAKEELFNDFIGNSVFDYVNEDKLYSAYKLHQANFISTYEERHNKENLNKSFPASGFIMHTKIDNEEYNLKRTTFGTRFNIIKTLTYTIIGIIKSHYPPNYLIRSLALEFYLDFFTQTATTDFI